MVASHSSKFIGTIMNKINYKTKKTNYFKTIQGYKYFRKGYTFPDGKYRRITAVNEVAWEEKVLEKIEEINKDLIDAESYIKDLKDDFLTSSEYLAPKTYQRREMHMRRDIIPSLGHIKLKDLKTIDIRRYYLQVLRTHGINKVFEINNVLNVFIEWAINTNIAIDTNPITKGLLKEFRQKINRLKIESSIEEKDESINVEDMMTIMNAVKGKRQEVIYSLQIQSGLRISEALAVTYKDVDLVKGFVKINKQVTELVGKMKVGRWADKENKLIAPPKTTTSNREISLTPTLRRIVEETPTNERKGYLFKTKDGEVSTSSNWVARHHKPLMDKLGLNYKTHDLRKFFGSFHASIGTPIQLVSKQMGHSKVSTTLDYYTKEVKGLDNEINAISEMSENSTKIALNGQKKGQNESVIL